MNNVYFSNEGITSTNANFYANIAKELQNAATERLNNVKFFKTSVAVIGSNEKQVMNDGNTDLEFILGDLSLISQLNSFCAWVREAIKEKDNQMREVNNLDITAWANKYGIELPEKPSYPEDIVLITEQDVMNMWDINKRNRYLRLEAFASTFGKYIHPNGAYSNARKAAHTAANNRIVKEGIGRDMVFYYSEPTISLDDIDKLFMILQDEYRKYEKELNQLKAELKETANKINCDNDNQYHVKIDAYRTEQHEYNTRWSEIRTQFNTWRTKELERISKLKITIPDALKPIFNIIKAAGDTSK